MFAKRVLVSGILLVLCMTGLITLPQVHAAPTCSPSQSSSWQICGPIESPNTINLQPDAIQVNDGTLGMVWLSLVGSNLAVLYASGTWDGVSWSWSTGTDITTQAGKNQNPALAQLANTTTYMFWSYKPSTSPNYQLYYLKQNGGLFSKTYVKVPLTNPTPLNDTLPSASVGRDGTLYLVWTRDNSTRVGTTPVMRQLWYKTLKNGVWSVEQPLTSATDVNWNYQPSVAVGKDGVVRVVFSRGRFSTNVFDVYYMTYSGSSWSSPQAVTTQTTTQDSYPTIAQDRNGTFWVFWSRNLGTGNSTAYSVFESSSFNNGSNWTGGTGLTPTSCGSSGCDSEYPTAVQSTSDKNIWVFYATNPVLNFNIYALETTSPVTPVHDVAIVPYTNTPLPAFIRTNASQVYPGGLHVPYGWVNGVYTPINESALVRVTVNVQNFGDFAETVTLSLSVTNTTTTKFATSVFQLSPGAITVNSFNWNTTGFKPARYGITANASIPIVTMGNKLDGLIVTTNLVHLLPPGDVNQDGSVTISDVTVVFSAYNFSCFTATTCSPTFMSAQWGDVDGSPVIDIVDATVVAQNYNTFT